MFHEYIFLLGRIACNCVNTSETISGKLQDFFVEKLQFRKVIDADKAHFTYDDLTKKAYNSDDEGEDIFSDEEEGEDWESEEEMDEQSKMFYQFIQKK